MSGSAILSRARICRTRVLLRHDVEEEEEEEQSRSKIGHKIPVVVVLLIAAAVAGFSLQARRSRLTLRVA